MKGKERKKTMYKEMLASVRDSKRKYETAQKKVKLRVYFRLLLLISRGRRASTMLVSRVRRLSSRLLTPLSSILRTV